MEVLLVECESQLLPQLLDVFEGIDARRENEEDRIRRRSLLIRLGKLNLFAFGVFLPQFLLDETPKYKGKEGTLASSRSLSKGSQGSFP